jgi:S1-C subfamily serine protease
VVLTNPDMDIALVEFKDKAEVEKMEKDVGHKLPSVKLFKGNAKLGMDVVAMGFPLGQSTVKITEGVLSGHEKVGEFLSYQQTAPISPGNSGGPLFISGTKEVLRINFAAAVGESSQNNNYAIPSWHVEQMLHEYDATAEPPAEDADLPSATYNQATCRASHTNCIYHVPKMKAMAMAGNEELYSRFGCPAGIFVNKIDKGSIASSAQPPILEKSFITAVNGMTIDKFGMVKSDKYFGDPIIFTDIGVMSPTFKAVTVSACNCGKTEDHEVSTSALRQHKDAKLEEEQNNVPHMEEPGTAKMDFEEFGGVTVQPLTVNIIKSLAEGHGRMDLIRFAVKKQKKPMLVVTGVAKVKERTGSLQVGDILASVNGHAVSTLQDFRDHFEPTGSNGEWEGEDQCKSGEHMWTLETTTGKELAEDWHEALKYQREAIMRGDKPLSIAVKKALKKSHHGVPSLMQKAPAPAVAAPVMLPIEQRTNVRRGGAPGFDVASFIKGIM